MSPLHILNTQFGYKDFKEGQEEIINSILSGKNVLAVMPTGAGKSICYQIPALILDNFSIVISPLISLMQDQVNALNKKGISAAYINSSLDYLQTEKVLNNIANKKIKLLYIAPEKINNSEFITRIKNLQPSAIFVDEAHCISEWGHNFRPSYRYIRQFAGSIGVTRISAFTATATPEVREDIIKQLDFLNPSIFVYGFERSNLSLNVFVTKKKKENIAQLLEDENTPAIIYTSTRKNAEQLTEFLKLKRINAEFYHAGLTTELRKIIQDDFLLDRIKVIVATNAFGMGIDKQNIGMVIHYNSPGTIENLYQEFGRAGRNNNEAKVILFYSENDKRTQEFLIQLNYPTFDQIKQTYDAILDYYQVAVNSKLNSVITIDNNLLKLIESKGVQSGLLTSILSNLEMNEYLKFHSSSSIDTFIKFNLSPEQLKNYLKDITNNELKDFVINLIKFFGNKLFIQKTKVDFNNIEIKTGYSIHNSKEYFNTLERVGIIEYDQPAFHPKIEMLRERVPSKDLRLDVNDINDKLFYAKKKLNSVIDYVFTKECRFKFILKYFGEDVKNYKCRKCDNCRKSTSKDGSSEEYISEIILRTLKEFKGGLTGNRLIGILKGESKSKVAAAISTYQSCSNYKKEQLQNVIDSLKINGTVKTFEEKIFFNSEVDLSFGEDLYNNNDNETNQLFDYENHLELYNKLREERKLASKKFSQSAEMICSDQILKRISKDQPSSTSGLLKISGVNQRMYNKIGLEFLSIIKEHKNLHKIKTDEKNLPKHISQTYKLVQKGYSLSEISNLLKLPESIVSIQIETIISFYPNEKYSSLIIDEEFQQIKNAMEYINEDLKEIKKKLPSKISYAKIRVVKAILSSSADSSTQL